MVKKPVLGKGLAALLGDDISNNDKKKETTTNPDKSNLLFLNTEQIVCNRDQPRKVFDENDLKDLAESIKKYGVLQPIIVHAIDNNKFEIIAGERRWRAAQMVGLEVMPSIIHSLSTAERMKVSLVENIQRQQLSSLEEAMAYENLMEMYGFTQETLAQTLGKSRSYIANILRLNKLHPSVKKALSDRLISYGHARCLINQEKAERFLEEILENTLSVRETENLVKGKNNAKKSSNISNNTFYDSDDEKLDDIKILEHYLTESLKTKVNIVVEGNEKKLVICFNTFNDLEDIIKKIT